jgi:hypothetical protein
MPQVRPLFEFREICCSKPLRCLFAYPFIRFFSSHVAFCRCMRKEVAWQSLVCAVSVCVIHSDLAAPCIRQPAARQSVVCAVSVLCYPSRLVCSHRCLVPTAAQQSVICRTSLPFCGRFNQIRSGHRTSSTCCTRRRRRCRPGCRTGTWTWRSPRRSLSGCRFTRRRWSSSAHVASALVPRRTSPMENCFR